ncbi:hypothetical protein A3759_30190 [Thalassolituus sp. HI0120]|nr:hypothetical protein A3759_12215 [Thalassolituus sp. HI0120]KZZ47366.1 hypothetical protein A3759_30190 [Thalassolituus sp. HI0120]
MMKKVILAAALLLMAGCSTIHFDRNPEPQATPFQTEEWHHNAILALVEVSDPVNLEDKCEGNKEWTSVKTELTFVNGLVSGLVNIFFPLWYPKTVEVSCK